MREIITKRLLPYIDIPSLRPGTVGAYALAIVSGLDLPGSERARSASRMFRDSLIRFARGLSQIGHLDGRPLLVVSLAGIMPSADKRSNVDFIEISCVFRFVPQGAFTTDVEPESQSARP